MVARYLEGKVVYLIGSGSEAHRGVAVALAEAGADLAIGGKGGMPDEVPLHSIANEIWAMNRRAVVVTLDEADPMSFAAGVASVIEQLGRADLVLRCDSVATV